MNVRQHIVAAFFSICIVAPLAWMIMDREPPYIRQNAEIIPAAPESCEPLIDAHPTGISPGACVSVVWRVKTLRNCPPDIPNNVTRSITDSEGVRWPLDPINGIYGTLRTAPQGITRFFRIPSAAARGPAVYRSTATFACNPMQKLWPISVSSPEVRFEIQ